MAGTPIKILHVVFSLEPGGMENGLVNVANALNPNEFQMHVCCLERPGAFVERLKEPRYIHVLDKKPGFSLKTAWRLARLISNINPQIIHTHNLGPLIYAGLAARMGGARPILHGEHSQLTDEECQPRRLRQRKFFYRNCRKVHTVSSGLRKQLIQFGLPEGKITALLNGVDTNRFMPGCRQTARQQLGKIPESSLVLGIVGRFGPYKRHALLIEAFDRLARHFPDVHLMVVGGGGPEEKRIALQVQASEAAGRIHLMGFQKDPRIFYQAMDMLVVPSINEGLSNAVLESMACGVPVLSHTACGNAEVIRHAEDGLVADLDTVEKLQVQLESVFVDPTRLTGMGQKARENVSKRFSIATMVGNYENLYREIAGREVAVCTMAKFSKA